MAETVTMEHYQCKCLAMCEFIDERIKSYKTCLPRNTTSMICYLKVFKVLYTTFDSENTILQIMLVSGVNVMYSIELKILYTIEQYSIWKLLLIWICNKRWFL